MTLPVWTVNPYTPLTIANIKTEFNGNIPAEISDYYRGGPTGLVTLDRVGFPFGVETPIPTTGNLIGVSNFYGASQVPYSISTDKLVYNEGDRITFLVTAPEDDGSRLFWTIEDSSISLSLEPKVLPNPVRGRAFNANLSTVGGVPPYTYIITHGALPSGLNITPEGRISGITSATGSYTFNVNSTDDEFNGGNQTYTLTIFVPDLIINPSTLTNGLTKVDYSQTITATNGSGSYTYSVASGSLPSGLSLNSVTGIISGKPQTVGNSQFRISAVDAGGNRGTRDYYLVVEPVTITIFPATLTDARQTFSYSLQLSAAGGQSPYSWSIVGSLPAGLSISSAGLISGTPTVSGSFNFTIKVVDANGNETSRNSFLKVVSNKWEITLNGYGAAPVSVNEGETLNFTIKSPETIESTLGAFLVVGSPRTTDGSDLTVTVGNPSFPVSIVNRQGTGTIKIIDDFITEGSEYFDVWVEYPIGTRRETFGRINVNDTSMTPTFTANISPATARPGDTIVLSWTTTNSPAGSYVKIDKFNSVQTLDVNSYPTTSTKNYTAPTTGGVDSQGGGTWTSELRLFLANGYPILSATPSYSVTAATYSITPNKRFLYEGQSVSYQISTTNVANGTVLYWINEGSTNGSDFTDLTNSGTVTINNNTATITRATSTNNGSLTSNATQTINITLKSISVNGPELADSGIVQLSGLQTFTITPDKTSVNEGDQVTWTVNTTSIPNGTILFWNNLGTSTNADFTDTTNSGTVTINNQSGTITRSVTGDLTTEGNETIIIQVRVDSPRGTIVAVSAPVTISDTSQSVNEIITGPATAPITQPITVTITGGIPNTTFSYTGAATGSGTLDTQGIFTFPSVDFSPYGPGTYSYNFLFNGSGNRRTYTVTITAVAVVPTFTNGDFEATTPVTVNGDVVQIPGWKIYNRSVRLNGFSTIQGHPTPVDPTPSPRNAPTPYGDSPTGTATFIYSFVNESPSGTGTTVLRLQSIGGFTNQPYGILRGPYVVSDSIINAQVGDTAEFWWKAEGGDDDFDVFAYLLNETTGDTVRLLDANGSTTSWSKVSKIIAAGEEGTYRFIFISGSYDASGGQALGASLYLDSIKLIKP